MIRNFRELLDHFGADTPSGLNRRIYKDTECGASLSILLAGPTQMGTWVHNGDRRWQTLTGDELLRGFTIQTIVEGSDATVDSELFTLPVRETRITEWIEDMEKQAAELWDEANKQYDQDGNEEED